MDRSENEFFIWSIHFIQFLSLKSRNELVNSNEEPCKIRHQSASLNTSVYNNHRGLEELKVKEKPRSQTAQVYGRKQLKEFRFGLVS